MAFPRDDQVDLSGSGHVVPVQVAESQGAAFDDAQGVSVVAVPRKRLSSVTGVQEVKSRQTVRAGEDGGVWGHARPMSEVGAEGKEGCILGMQGVVGGSV